jgi:D-3-phosphoglycerate dehydrogenase
MCDLVIESLILDLLEWVDKLDRSYEEVMDAWRTSCPKLPVWEEATDRRLVTVHTTHDHNIVRLTSTGRALLEQHRLAKR